MRSNPVRIGLLLTDEEYAKFRAACEKADTYPSKAAREAVLEWTEDTLDEGFREIAPTEPATNKEVLLE